VNREIDAALALSDIGSIQTIQFVIAVPCEVSPLLRGYKRVEQAGGLPYLPNDAALKTQAVITGTPAITPPSSPSPLPYIALPPRGPAPTPVNSLPSDDLTPSRLNDLGFRGYSIGGVKCILPPICPVRSGIFTMGSNKTYDKEAGWENYRSMKLWYCPSR
jgi:hypothetical protein